jgi:hypothetical protein
VNRTHRLKALGNGIVPAVAYIFAAAIADVLEAEATRTPHLTSTPLWRCTAWPTASG